MLKGLLKGASKILIPKLIKKVLGEGKAIKKAKLTMILDRNKDGKFTLKGDFPELAKYADINEDGFVNFKDLVALAQKNNRKKLYIAIGAIVIGAVAYYFATKYGWL